MKIKIVIGLVALAVNGAMASPRTDYLIEKIKEA